MADTLFSSWLLIAFLATLLVMALMLWERYR